MNSWYLVLQNKIPSDICNELIELYQNKQKQKAQTIGKNKDYRKTNVVGINYGSDDHKSLSALMNPFINMSNRECFGFSLNGVSEFQIAEYDKGHFYKEHMDCFLHPIASQRKLSITVQLSSSEDYKGGDFVFSKDIGTPDKDLIREQGRIIVFPSFIYHEVKPVIKGKRYSLVGWYEGNHFQ